MNNLKNEITLFQKCIFWLLGYILGIIGLIIYFLLKNKMENNARLVYFKKGVIFSLVVSIIAFIIGFLTPIISSIMAF